MSMRIISSKRAGMFACLVVLGLVAALIVVPFLAGTKAADNKAKGLLVRTESSSPELPNYDIRMDKVRRSTDFIESARSISGRFATDVADIRENFVRGENRLKERLPQVKFEYNEDIRIPEVITPNVSTGRIQFLTAPSNETRSEILRGFVKENNDLVGINDQQADGLKVTADYTNPDGNLSFAQLEQEINGIPVFRGEVKAGFNRNGQIVRVINNLAPGLNYDLLSDNFGDPLDSVMRAAGHINVDTKSLDLNRNAAASNDIKTAFGIGDWATTAEKIYFPTEPGVALPSWRVLIWQPVNAYYVIVDAQTGTMLWRKNITSDQTSAATYQIYPNANAMINTADNPAPLTPGPITPASGTQGAITPARTNVSLIGNEGPNLGMNNLGWITDGTNFTDGNNLEAGIDRDGINGVDATQPGDTACPGAGCRVFSSTWNPPPGNPAPGDAPLTAQAQRGAVIQMFYAMNLYHDVLYSLGFNEQSRNFQNDNFGRGGNGNDRVSAEGQDSSGTNNANFSSPADGGRGRMQMFIWTGPNPDYDGTTDIEIVIHEVTHGTSNRLHGNSSGLSTNMSRGMGEGWSDFYGHSLLSEPGDPINGIYTIGGYATYLGAGGFVSNYYHGIRRFPKAVRAFTGGPNNRPHNPLTFADVDSTQFNIGDGAFGPGPFGSSTSDQVHNLGEIWSSALWEVRAKLVTRLGWAVGNRKALQFVTDGMKLSPLGPTFLQSRDAIIAAALASSFAPEAEADANDVWGGFAIRGMGFDAQVLSAGSGASNTRVVESFALPNLRQTPGYTVSDVGGGDGDGFPEPGETLTLLIPLVNNTGSTATGTTLQVVGGGSANYGTIANGSTVFQSATYTVPGATACGAVIPITLNVNSNLGPVSFQTSLIIGAAEVTFSENFDGVTAPNLPAGWTATPVAGGVNFVSTTTNPDTGPNSMFALDPTTVGGGTDLVSPSFAVTAAAATVSFRNRYDTEEGWDGGLLEMSLNGGVFQDFISLGGSFISNGYNSVLGANGVNNPIAGRNAWSGNSGGYVTTVVRLPAIAAGQNVRMKWRFGADDNTASNGWNIDTFKVNGNYTCSTTGPTVRSPVDFDGDGKTDVSIFRPAPAEWWYLKSSDGGNGALQFGATTDKIAPGDYTGDGKTDIAFWRPSTGEWYILRSEDNSFFSFPFGANGDTPVPADYDGDGKTDAAVFRGATQNWFILNSGGGGTVITTFGIAGDKPVVADYDGDGKADIAIFRPGPGEWWYSRSGGGATVALTFGTSTDKQVQGDYTGDGKADVAFFRPSTGFWFIQRSEDNSFYSVPFGTTGDLPAPGDYDGDGKYDTTVFRPSTSTWFSNRSTSGTMIVTFGITGDQPVPAAFVP